MSAARFKAGDGAFGQVPQLEGCRATTMVACVTVPHGQRQGPSALLRVPPGRPYGLPLAPACDARRRLAPRIAPLASGLFSY
jgi:hypothetical protein